MACVYGVPPICAPFAWHLFLLRLAHRRHQDDSQHEQDTSQHPPDTPVLTGQQDEPAVAAEAAGASSARNGQGGEPSRVLVRVLLAGETQDRPVSWQDVADRTGLSRSRAYALLREERARLTAGNGHQPTLDPTDTAPYPAPRPAREGSTAMRVHLRVLVPGTRVRIRRPSRGEHGLWVVGDRLVGSGLHDPADQLHHQPSGRTRILRRSRLRLTRSTATSSRGR